VIRDPRDVLTRPAPPASLELRYGEHDDQVVEVWLPPDCSSAPLVIFLHGGFWRAQWDRSHAKPLAADLARRGYPVALVEYRRVGQPGGGWPGTFADVAAALAAVPHLLTETLAFRGLPAVNIDRPVLMGHSAGGHLALWYAGVAPDAVRGVLALAPVADLSEAYRLRLDNGAVADLLDGDPATVPDRYKSADPLARLPLNVPVVIVHGADDVQVPIGISKGYVLAAQQAGDDVALIDLPGVEHFAVIDPLSSAWPAVLDGLRALARPDSLTRPSGEVV
jgi:acetyl esterase/lipase